jgi:alpha-tubulin suppressor-like RCC1 family protein
MAIKYDGTLWAWGNNSLGQLGLNNRIHRSSPVQIGTSSWSLVSAGDEHTLAIRSDGRLFAWGYNILGGQLGTGDTVHRSSPTQIGTDSWLQVSAGFLHTLGIESDGSLYAWGYNDSGRLGLNDTTSRFSPVLVAANNGIGSLSNDVLKTGQYISINNQIRIVNTLISNTNISVTVAFTANSSNQELQILV